MMIIDTHTHTHTHRHTHTHTHTCTYICIYLMGQCSHDESKGSALGVQGAHAQEDAYIYTLQNLLYTLQNLLYIPFKPLLYT